MGVVSYKPRPLSAVCLKIDFLLAILQFWITFPLPASLHHSRYESSLLSLSGAPLFIIPLPADGARPAVQGNTDSPGAGLAVSLQPHREQLYRLP